MIQQEGGRPNIGKSAQLIYKPSFLDDRDMRRCLERELEDLSQALHKIVSRIEALETKPYNGDDNGKA